MAAILSRPQWAKQKRLSHMSGIYFWPVSHQWKISVLLQSLIRPKGPKLISMLSAPIVPNIKALLWNGISNARNVKWVIGLFCAHSMNDDVNVQGLVPINQSHKSTHASVPYPTLHHSEQKCTHFCSEWCIVGYGTGALWDLWIRSIDMYPQNQIN